MKRAASRWCGAGRGVETARTRCGGFVYISWGIRGEFGGECDGFCRMPFENSDEFDLSLDSLALPSP